MDVNDKTFVEILDYIKKKDEIIAEKDEVIERLQKDLHYRISQIFHLTSLSEEFRQMYLSHIRECPSLVTDMDKMVKGKSLL